MIAADKNKDTALAGRAIAWINASQKAGDTDSGYASYIGDILNQLELPEQATSYWTVHVKADPNSSESRECAARLLRTMETSRKGAFIESLLKTDTNFQGRYSTWLADLYLQENQLDRFAEILKKSKEAYRNNPLQSWDLDLGVVCGWVTNTRSNTEIKDPEKTKIYRIVEAMEFGTCSAIASLATLESAEPSAAKMDRVLEIQKHTLPIDSDWNAGFHFSIRAICIEQRDYLQAATLASGMLSNLPQTDERRLKSVRDIVTQCYARMGSVGLTIDEDSPIAPLLQAALYLRLGDEKLAYSTYDANRTLFDENRNVLPVDLITFVCRQRMAAGGDDNHNFVEDVLRGWLVANSESPRLTTIQKQPCSFCLLPTITKRADTTFHAANSQPPSIVIPTPRRQLKPSSGSVNRSWHRRFMTRPNWCLKNWPATRKWISLCGQNFCAAYLPSAAETVMTHGIFSVVSLSGFPVLAWPTRLCSTCRKSTEAKNVTSTN